MTRDPFDPGLGGQDEPKPVGYYGEPILKKPHWGWSVVTYLFLGGIMGGSSNLLPLADERDDGDRMLARNARYLGLALAVACPVILITHLGRPERFLHMLRIVKLRSPMSVGVWSLFVYGNLAGLSAIGQAARDGVLPKWLQRLVPRRLTDLLLALLGSFVASYTGVLISATAVPLWAKGRAYIPPLFVCSGVSAACAVHAALLALRPGTQRTRRKLERLDVVASFGKAALLLAFRRHAGRLGAPMFEGERGRHLRLHTMIGGILLPAILNLLPFEARWMTLLTSALTLRGGYLLRETVIEAGKASADDPKAALAPPE